MIRSAKLARLSRRRVLKVMLNGSATTTMPAGAGVSTGYTSNLGGATGNDLGNDHPISITFNDALAQKDRELITTGNATLAVDDPFDAAEQIADNYQRFIKVYDEAEAGARV